MTVGADPASPVRRRAIRPRLPVLSQVNTIEWFLPVSGKLNTVEYILRCISACTGRQSEFRHSPQTVTMVLSPEIRKPFLAIFGAVQLPHGIINLLISTADVALMLVAVTTVADAIGIRYLENRPAVTARRSCTRWRARRR